MTDQNNAALDLCTSSGGRAYIADYFATQLRRHDFAKYINSTLAADFACALAQHLSKLRAEGVQAGEAPPLDQIKKITDRARTLVSHARGLVHVHIKGNDASHAQHCFDDATRWLFEDLTELEKLASAPVAGVAFQQLAEELSDLASDMAYEANQEMDQEKASRAAVIERGERALRRFADAAPQAGEAVRNADQDEMERLGWVNIGYKHDLEKARRAISFCNIPGFDTMSLDNAIYWLRAKADKDGVVDESPNLQGTSVDRSADLQGGGDCAKGAGDESAPFAPDWANYRQGWADGLAEGGEAIDIARTALMEIADLADVEADQRGVIVNEALTRIDEITARAALAAQKQGDSDGSR